MAAFSCTAASVGPPASPPSSRCNDPYDHYNLQLPQRPSAYFFTHEIAGLESKNGLGIFTRAKYRIRAGSKYLPNMKRYEMLQLLIYASCSLSLLLKSGNAASDS